MLELDTFNISGGKVECTAGNVIITYAGNISVSGSGLDVNGAGLTVGTWFNCKLPEYAEFAQSGIAESENYFNAISISPNPSSGTIKINSKYVYHNMLLKIINIHGQIVQSGYYATPDSENVDISSLRNGLYFWEIESANSISRGKLLISR